jgi:hypothetical protein
MLDVGAICVGEGVERHPLRGSRQQRGDPGHFAGEDRVPAFQELVVRHFNPE